MSSYFNCWHDSAHTSFKPRLPSDTMFVTCIVPSITRQLEKGLFRLINLERIEAQILESPHRTKKNANSMCMSWGTIRLIYRHLKSARIINLLIYICVCMHTYVQFQTNHISRQVRDLFTVSVLGDKSVSCC